MFFVIDKEKVYAYIVSILTVVVLLFISHTLSSDSSNSKVVSSDIYDQNAISPINETVNKIENGLVPN